MRNILTTLYQYIIRVNFYIIIGFVRNVLS